MYCIYLTYSNGRTSHKITTTKPKKARDHLEKLVADPDLKSTANMLVFEHNRTTLLLIKMSDMNESVIAKIAWPYVGARKIIKEPRRASISIPMPMYDFFKEIGEGNASKGIQTAGAELMAKAGIDASSAFFSDFSGT